MIFIFKHFSILIKDRLTRICELANRNCNHVEAVPGQSGNQDDYRDHAYPFCPVSWKMGGVEQEHSALFICA